MSRENVEIVMGFFPAPDVNIVPLFRDDQMWMELVEAEAPFVHADVESVVAGLADSVGVLPGRGRAVHRSGRAVLALSFAFGRLEGSTAEVKLTHGDVWTIRDGKLARVVYYTVRAEALKAVGLEE